MSKKKLPLQLLEYLKKKEAKKPDGSEMSDNEKRKAALNKAKKYKEQKNKINKPEIQKHPAEIDDSGKHV